MLFCDMEVFAHDWLGVFIDMEKQTETDIVNDQEKLEKFWNDHKNEIWSGYNIRRYDQYIIQSILCGFNPKECNDWIIVQEKSGYSFSPLLKEYPIILYDVMQNIDKSLKWFEGSMGNSIKETDVSFDTQRKLTKDELELEVQYCRNDVEQTIEVFMERKDDFNACMSLIKMYKLPLNFISKTKVQLSAEILYASKHEWDDEFDVSLPPVMDVKKYTQVPEWFMDPENHHYKDGNNTHQLKIMMGGIEMVFGYGGVHGAVEHYHSKGYFVNMDVGSLYPSLDVLYPEYCFSRAVPKQGLERYKEILKYRLQLKAEGKKKEQAPFKIVLNGTYGAMKDKFNKLYDPRSNNNTVIFGQVLVGVDLFEKLEPFCEMIQTNTDGILVRMPDGQDPDEWFSRLDDVAYEWEHRTGLTLEFDDYGYGEMFQKDVNNYVIIDGYDGHFKSKGGYVKKQSRLDNDMPIVNRALVEFMTQGTPVEKTIMDCDDLIQFQIVRKITSKYKCLMYGDTVLSERCVRVFASSHPVHGGLTKIHATTGRPAKVEGTPAKCMIWNDDVLDETCPDVLDKQWYINEAKERLKGFGI